MPGIWEKEALQVLKVARDHLMIVVGRDAGCLCYQGGESLRVMDWSGEEPQMTDLSLIDSLSLVAMVLYLSSEQSDRWIT